MTAIAPAAPDSRRALTQIVDCPQCVWSDFGAPGLDRDFRSEWTHALDGAGTQAVREHLISAWRKRGYHVELVCHHLHQAAGEMDVPIQLCHQVWREATDMVADDELVFLADLVDQYAAWGDR